jgi:hypothetical protein
MTEEIPKYLGERVQKKEKLWLDLDVGTRREETVLDGRRGKKVQNVL